MMSEILKADFEPPFDFPQVVQLARRPLTPPVWGACAAKVRLACPLAAQGPRMVQPSLASVKEAAQKTSWSSAALLLFGLRGDNC